MNAAEVEKLKTLPEQELKNLKLAHEIANFSKPQWLEYLKTLLPFLIAGISLVWNIVQSINQQQVAKADKEAKAAADAAAIERAAKSDILKTSMDYFQKYVSAQTDEQRMLLCRNIPSIIDEVTRKILDEERLRLEQKLIAQKQVDENKSNTVATNTQASSPTLTAAETKQMNVLDSLATQSAGSSQARNEAEKLKQDLVTRNPALREWINNSQEITKAERSLSNITAALESKSPDATNTEVTWLKEGYFREFGNIRIWLTDLKGDVATINFNPKGETKPFQTNVLEKGKPAVVDFGGKRYTVEFIRTGRAGTNFLKQGLWYQISETETIGK